jgi:alpha-glucosidase
MLNGAADYTICYFDKRLRNTHAHQLAASLIMFSPLQTIFWYDTPERCAKVPELRWFEELPTTFDDTRIISGYPGEHIVMVRRQGEAWYAALMTGNEGSLQTLPLDFLDSGTQYLAQVYTDDPSLPTVTKVHCAEYVVQAGQTMRFDLLPRGGATVRFTPISKQEARGYERYRNNKTL